MVLQHCVPKISFSSTAYHSGSKCSPNRILSLTDPGAIQASCEQYAVVPRTDNSPEHIGSSPRIVCNNELFPVPTAPITAMQASLFVPSNRMSTQGCVWLTCQYFSWGYLNANIRKGHFLARRIPTGTGLSHDHFRMAFPKSPREWVYFGVWINTESVVIIVLIRVVILVFIVPLPVVLLVVLWAFVLCSEEVLFTDNLTQHIYFHYLTQNYLLSCKEDSLPREIQARKVFPRVGETLGICWLQWKFLPKTSKLLGRKGSSRPARWCTRPAIQKPIKEAPIALPIGIAQD